MKKVYFDEQGAIRRLENGVGINCRLVGTLDYRPICKNKCGCFSVTWGDPPSEFAACCGQPIAELVEPPAKPCCGSPSQEKCDQCQETGTANPLNNG